MGAKRSGEMKYAIILYKRYKSVSRAASEAQVHPTALYRALAKQGLRQIAKRSA